MPRTASPDVRTALVERAASLLARREPVTLRALVAGTGVSTMAVYTHFDGMPGLWRAVRQEGFTRLAGALSAVDRTDDPVRDLAAIGAAYAGNALAHPDLYRAMFDPQAELDDPAAAAATFQALVECTERARDAGRFRGDLDPTQVATRYWVCGHGLCMLALSGLLSRSAVAAQGPALTAAVAMEAGDEPVACRRSVSEGWPDPDR